MSCRETKADLINRLAKLKIENKTLKEILLELKGVESSGFLPDGDSINLSTKMWLERLIQKIKEKETK